MNGIFPWIKKLEREAYDSAVKTFLEDIFHNDQTVPVNEETIKVYRDRYQQYHQQHENLVRTWTKLEEIELMLPIRKNEGRRRDS